MKHSRLLVAALLSVAALLGAVAVVVACSHRGSGTNPPPGGLAQLEQDTGVQWTAMPDSRFGTTSYLFPQSTPPVTLTSGVQPSTAAMAFFVKYGGVLSMVDPAHEVTPADSGESQGLSFASFTQSEGPADVYGTRLTMGFDSGGPAPGSSGVS